MLGLHIITTIHECHDSKFVAEDHEFERGLRAMATYHKFVKNWANINCCMWSGCLLDDSVPFLFSFPHCSSSGSSLWWPLSSSSKYILFYVILI